MRIRRDFRLFGVAIVEQGGWGFHSRITAAANLSRTAAMHAPQENRRLVLPPLP